jgi:hypothetical protein
MVSEKKSPNGDKNPLEGIKKPLESCRVYVTMAKAWYCGHRLYLNGALSMSCTSQLATTWRCSLDNWPGVVWCSLGSPKKIRTESARTYGKLVIGGGLPVRSLL